jgi:hypothetical protein
VNFAPHFDEEFGDEGAGGVVGEVADEFQRAGGVGGAELAEGVKNDWFDGMLGGVVALGGGEKFAVDIDGENGAAGGRLGEQAREVADARADFEDYIVGGDGAGLDEGAQDILIDHEVLAELMAGAHSGGSKDGGNFSAVHGLTTHGVPAAREVAAGGLTGATTTVKAPSSTRSSRMTNSRVSHL